MQHLLNDVRRMATVSIVTARSTTLGVAVERRFELCTCEFSFVRTRRQNSLSFVNSRTTHILRVHGHTTLQEKRAAEVYDEDGQSSLERLFRGSQRTAWCKPRSVQASPEWDTKERETLRLRHTALTAAKPRIQAMIQDAVVAGLLSKQLMGTRIDAVFTLMPSIAKTRPWPSCMFRGGPGSKRSVTAKNRWL